MKVLMRKLYTQVVDNSQGCLTVWGAYILEQTCILFQKARHKGKNVFH